MIIVLTLYNNSINFALALGTRDEIKNKIEFEETFDENNILIILIRLLNNNNI